MFLFQMSKILLILKGVVSLWTLQPQTNSLKITLSPVRLPHLHLFSWRNLMFLLGIILSWAKTLIIFQPPKEPLSYQGLIPGKLKISKNLRILRVVASLRTHHLPPQERVQLRGKVQWLLLRSKQPLWLGRQWGKTGRIEFSVWQ